MKIILTLALMSALLFQIFAQAPEKMSYQAVVRNTSGELVTSQVIGMKVSILQGSATGPVVYSETYSPNPQTNANGLVTIEIGRGVPGTGTFAGIGWASGPFFLKVETDPGGGTNYQITGVSPLLSVPYALYAQNAGNGFSGNYEDLTNKPRLFDGTWTSLTGKPFTLTGYGITDGMSTTHPANSISSAMMANWTSAFNWGDHAGLYKPVNYFPSWSEITGIPGGFADGEDNVDDADNSITNEIQVLTLSGHDLSLSREGGMVTIPGDNWGTQAVVTDATLAGNGTTTAPLQIARQTAIAGQVLKWSGSTWMPADDDTSSVLKLTLPYKGRSADENFLFHMINDGQGGGIRGETIGSTGLLGLASGTLASNIGTAGQSASPSGVGIWGNNIALTGNGIAVKGSVQATTGYSGFFERGRFYIEGNTGIGTLNPGSKLEVAGQVKITGGSPGSGKVLTSDATGLASWQTPAPDPWLTSGSNIYYNSGIVGIGTSSPVALLHVEGTGTGQGNVVFNGQIKESDPGPPPVSGTGTRMMWYPDKAAFRVGVVDGDFWDQSNVGYASFAACNNTVASGFASVALGTTTTASGFYSAALGVGTIASGTGTTAMGANTTSSGMNSVSMGYSTTASGWNCLALGNSSTAAGNNSIAAGYQTQSAGDNSLASGRGTIAYAYASSAFGRFNVGGGDRFNWVVNDPLFEIGIGSSETARANAITVMKNGNTGIGTATPSVKLEVAGQIKITGGSPGAGKVLTSDSQGLANWKTPGLELPYSDTAASVNYAPLFNIKNTDQGAAIMGTGSSLGTSIGVAGHSLSQTGKGLQGYAEAFSGINYGVLGVSNSTSGTGVNGQVSALSGINFGIWGSVKSPDAFSGYFDGAKFYVSGKVGLGITSPSQRLHIKGNIPGNAVVLIEPNKWDAAGDYGELRFGDANHYIRGEHTTGMTFNDANKFTFTGGNVGIGINNPSAKLDVSASQGPNVIIRDSDGGAGRPGIQFINNYIHYIGGDDGSEEIFGIYSGYGDTRNYAARLNIHGPATGNWGKYLGLTHDGSHGRISTDAGYLVLEPAGNRIGVGTDAPTQSLDVNGTLRVRGMTTGTSAGTVYRSSDGTLITGASDVRLKENIEPLENSLEKVMQLNGVYFSWKDDPDHRQNIGFIAQDFEQVIPELVFTNDNDGYKGINYAEVSAVIVEAMKEQQKIIEELRTENNRLKAEQITHSDEIRQMREEIKRIITRK